MGPKGREGDAALAAIDGGFIYARRMTRGITVSTTVSNARSTEKGGDGRIDGGLDEGGLVVEPAARNDEFEPGKNDKGGRRNIAGCPR